MELTEMLKAYKDRTGLSLAAIAKQMGISYDTIYKLSKGTTPRKLSMQKKIESFFKEFASITPNYSLNMSEDKLLKSLTLVSSYHKALAIRDIVEKTEKGGEWEYLTKYRTRVEVISALFEAISNGYWSVKEQSCYVIQLPTGHYLKSVYKKGDRSFEWGEKFDVDTVQAPTAEELKRLYPEYEEFVREKEEEFSNGVI